MDIETAFMNTLGMACIIFLAVAVKSVEAGVAIAAILSLLKEYYKYKDRSNPPKTLTTLATLPSTNATMYNLLSMFLIF